MECVAYRPSTHPLNAGDPGRRRALLALGGRTDKGTEEGLIVNVLYLVLAADVM